MCKRTMGFTGSMRVASAVVEFAIIDQLDDRRLGDAADEFLIGMDDGYETVELSQDAMDRDCVLLADCDVLYTREDAPYAAWDYEGHHEGTYEAPAEEGGGYDGDAQEQLSDTLLSDAKDTGWEYAQQDVTLVGGVRSMWAMKHSGQTIGW